MFAKAWLSIVLPCYHLKESKKDAANYLVLHGLGCQALILVLYWHWPEILPIWDTSDMANIRTVNLTPKIYSTLQFLMLDFLLFRD